MLRSLLLFLTTDQRHANSTLHESPTTPVQPWRSRGKTEPIPPINSYGAISFSPSASSSSHVALTQLRPAARDHSLSLLDRVSADLIPFATHFHGIFSFYRSTEALDTQSVSNVLAVGCEDRALIHIDTEGHRYRQSRRHSETMGHRSPGAWPESLQTYRERRRERPCRNFAPTERLVCCP
jgi:hypothetical protein